MRGKPLLLLYLAVLAVAVSWLVLYPVRSSLGLGNLEVYSLPPAFLPSTSHGGYPRPAAYWLGLALWLGGFAGTLALVLWPLRLLALRPRPRWRSLASAAIVWAVMLVGLLASLAEIDGRWHRVVGYEEPRPAGLLFRESAPLLRYRWWPLYLTAAAWWPVGLAVAWAVSRRSDAYRATRRLAWVTLALSAAVAGVSFWIYTQNSRWGVHYGYSIGRGCYVGLIAALIGALWAWGVGLGLWLAKQRPIDCCWSCGYDLRGTPGSACPECGAVRSGSVTP